jgi:pimeloyl-ACP methyl ester carboxylesterase
VKRTNHVWRILGETLVGTEHHPVSRAASGTALLLLNAGPAPRAGNSDLSVYIADRAASRGVTAFRFDAPGVGDSTGFTEPDIESYWRAVVAGRNDESTLAIIREIRRRFSIDRVLVGGLCAGAVTAMRVAERHAPAGGRVDGLVLIEPNFRLKNIDQPVDTDPAAAPAPPPASKWRRALSRREWLYALTGEGVFGRVASPWRARLLESLRKEVGTALPRDMNLPLVTGWERTLDRGVPSLVVTAEGRTADRSLRRISATFPPSIVRLIDHELVGTTNHILTSGDARDRTVDAVDTWLARRFAASSAEQSHARSA